MYIISCICTTTVCLKVEIGGGMGQETVVRTKNVCINTVHVQRCDAAKQITDSTLNIKHLMCSWKCLSGEEEASV